LRKVALFVALLVITSPAVWAAEVTVENAWTRAALSKAVKNAAGYLTIHNQADKPDVLIAIQSDIAEVTEIHEMTFKDGVMRMNAIGELHIPPTTEVLLEPGGYHVMFLGLKKPLYEGQQFEIKLTFKNAGDVKTLMNTLEPYNKKNRRE